MSERLDIYDEHMNLIGQADRSDVHQKGYWHRTFQCWIVNTSFAQPKLLFQKRHASKDTFPGKLDKSAAGHLTAGERMEDAVRELEEELGVAAPFNSLTKVGVIRSESVTPHWKDREFCHVFVLEYNAPLVDYKVQLEEVSGLFWLELKQYEALVSGALSTVHIEGFEWDELGRRSPSKQEVSISSFTPQHEVYYRTLFQSFREMGFLM